MLKGNKGEWSEIYTFVYLLASGKLYAADKDLNINPDIYFPVIKIIREELGENLSYNIETFDFEKNKILLKKSSTSSISKALCPRGIFSKRTSLISLNFSLLISFTNSPLR